MRYFAEYIVGRNGPIDVFLQPQTPRLVADEVARKLTSPAYLDGARHFAIVVWALPDGAGGPRLPRLHRGRDASARTAPAQARRIASARLHALVP